jgi:hypothetical protein
MLGLELRPSLADDTEQFRDYGLQTRIPNNVDRKNFNFQYSSCKSKLRDY